jgi:hypothetical protein
MSPPNCERRARVTIIKPFLKFFFPCLDRADGQLLGFVDQQFNVHNSPLLNILQLISIIKHLSTILARVAFCALLESVLMLLSVTIGLTFTSASGKVPCTVLSGSARWRSAHRPYFFSTNINDRTHI